MTSAGRAEPAPDDEPDLTVDELAGRVGLTVRNVRAYAARGLLPPPRLVGRTGHYGREHVARLILVREMLAEGYSLNMIERTLAHAPDTASTATLALHRALLAPWLPPEPETTTAADLIARAGVPESSAIVEDLAALGLVEHLADGRLRVLDPALLTAGLQVVELGVPPAALIAAQARVIALVREIAGIYVRMFVETGWQTFLEAGAPREQVEEVRAAVARLQPAAAQALLASFRTEMAAAVGAAVAAELGDPDEEPSG
ncbi:MAG TPA: MerR family transcriptional regulator [Modestobacter sp.]|jgi:DNA-binding transcriptional MerR regulator|nr:MerR family transcriptional regulator [Modestobacter sp.]